MNKKRITAITVLMALVLIGLVSLQIYWIKNAIALKEQQLNQSVHEALGEVAKKLEKKDAMTFFINEFFTQGNYSKAVDRRFRKMHNQLVNSFNNDLDLMMSEMGDDVESLKEMAWSPDKSMFPGMNVQFDTVIYIDSSKQGLYETAITIRVNDSVQNLCIKASNADQLQRNVDQQFRKIQHRKDLANDIFFQFFNRERTVQERVDPDEVKELLTNELTNQGVDIPFEYAVVNQYGRLVAMSDNFNTHGGNTIHQVRLFPDDIMSEPSYLALELPSKRSYIMKSLGVMSFSSIGLILIISLCFAYTIHIIFRQKKLSDMKTDFINNMTHEFKTPVSTISLASEMLRDDKVASDQAKVSRYANVIYDENKRLGGQVEKVLQMAVLEKGDLNLKLSDIDLHELVEKATDKLSLQVQNKNGVLNTSLEADYSIIKADEVHMTNIILNLLENALKYSHDKPEINVSTRNYKNGIILTIADKGIGMSKDAQKRVFEKFYRVPTGNLHDVKGFGLGLSYVKAMVDAHGGYISLKSEPGKGTTFEIFIPQSNQN